MARNSLYTRRTANFLLLARVKAKTRAAYSKAVKAFCAFLELRGVRLSLFDASAVTLDRHLLRFVEYVFDENDGKKRQLATNAMYGVILIRPDLKAKDKLPSARAVLQGWQTAFPSKKYPPLPKYVLYAMAYYVYDVLSLPKVAVALLLAWDGFFRIGEVASLKVGDVALPGDLRFPVGRRTAVVAIKEAKTGRNQTVRLRSPIISGFLAKLIAGRDKKKSLFGVSASRLRSIFHKARQGCGLHRVPHFAFHSIRHGAATAALLEDVPLQEVLRRGRWKAATSARHYIQEGEAMLVSLQIDTELLYNGSLIFRNIKKFFKI